MYKEGSLVVPLKRQRGWADAFPMYVTSMDKYVNQVGVVAFARGSSYVTVSFLSEDGTWERSYEYRRDWIRLATRAEKKIYKFILLIKRGSYVPVQ